jgi:hypothetical protein
MSLKNTPFLSAHLSVIAHATEDIGKVEKATKFLLQLISRAETNLTRQYARGHHGNVIATISAKLAGKALDANALQVIARKLSESEKQFLKNDIERCVDEEGSLYLRFDKQEAFLGSVTLCQGDPIRMKLKFAFGYDSDRIVDLCRESGLVS